ncbi:FHA domain-containing protein [Litoreibacter roseus]|uniref:FHA domain-containing protein n=1 Tax=Litoreibacter roseus TaxID=2601869 RepID=A0A6N6JD55_9RHOB|nr:FHA domain-containing protein [Litoreibacter roseus]GFE64085.1 hypothetical protein KIN_11590 [Litoreibacter roseus]
MQAGLGAIGAAMLCSLLMVGAPSFAQDSGTAEPTQAQAGTPQRYPETGIAILDCDPGAPAPDDSCLVRLPPKTLRNGLRASEEASFTFARPGAEQFPEDIALSATLLLVDVTPGLNSARRATFANEKALLRSFVEGLPEGESIALYTFKEDLLRVVDFTTDHNDVLVEIDALALTGRNTLIAEHTKQAIDILDRKSDVLLKNVILVTDGQDEGLDSIAEISAAAIEAEVGISALGMAWRGFGDAQVGRDENFLRRLTDGLGATQMVILRRPAEATTAVTNFAEDVSASRRGSGLIVPDGEAQAADIILELREPEPGVEGEYQTNEVRVRFVPVAGEAAPETQTPSEPAQVPEATLFGVPILWAYIVAGLLILLALVVLLMKRRSHASDTGTVDDDIDIDFGSESDADFAADPDDATQIVGGTVPDKTPSAFLVREPDNARMPLVGQRISIGRGSANAVILNDVSISRVHAELHRNRDGGYSVTDMDSLNGTFINGRQVRGTLPVRAGDTLKFGEISTKLVLP